MYPIFGVREHFENKKYVAKQVGILKILR